MPISIDNNAIIIKYELYVVREVSNFLQFNIYINVGMEGREKIILF